VYVHVFKKMLFLFVFPWQQTFSCFDILII